MEEFKAIVFCDGQEYEIACPFEYSPSSVPSLGVTSEKGENFSEKEINYSIRLYQKDNKELHDKLKDLHFNSLDKCRKIKTDIYQLCKGKYERILEGQFTLNKIGVNCNECKLIIPIDEDSVAQKIKQNWEKEKCFFGAPVQTVCGQLEGIENNVIYSESRIGPYTFTDFQAAQFAQNLPNYVSVDEIIAQGELLGPISPGDDCFPVTNSPPIPPILDKPLGWAVCENRVYMERGTTQVLSEFWYIHVKTTWAAQKITTNCIGGAPQPPLSNFVNDWILLNDNCSTDGTAEYIRPTCNPLGKELPDFTTRNFCDIMDFILAESYPDIEISFCSLFFNCNTDGLELPTGEKAQSVIATAATHYNCLQIAEFTDVLRPWASNEAGPQRWCKPLKDLREDLNRLFFNTLSFKIIENADGTYCFQVEHESYWRDRKNIKTLNQFFKTEKDYLKEIANAAVFSSDFAEIPTSEIFSYSLDEYTSADFQPFVIEYGDFCGEKGEEDNDIKCFQNDIVGACQPETIINEDGVVVANTETPDSIEKGTFSLMSVVKDVEGKMYLDANNKALTPAFIFENFGKWCRYFPIATVDGQKTEMCSVLATNKVQDITINICCPASFDPDCLYDIDFGCGPSGPFEVRAYTANSPTMGCAIIKLSYSCL